MLNLSLLSSLLVVGSSCQSESISSVSVFVVSVSDVTVILIILIPLNALSEFSSDVLGSWGLSDWQHQGDIQHNNQWWEQDSKCQDQDQDSYAQDQDIEAQDQDQDSEPTHQDMSK